MSEPNNYMSIHDLKMRGRGVQSTVFDIFADHEPSIPEIYIKQILMRKP